MKKIELLKTELRKILDNLDTSAVDGYFGSISVLATKNQIVKIIEKMGDNPETAFNEIKLLIAPTGDICEISTDNGWAEEYMKIAEEIDKIIGEQNEKSRCI